MACLGARCRGTQRRRGGMIEERPLSQDRELVAVADQRIDRPPATLYGTAHRRASPLPAEVITAAAGVSISSGSRWQRRWLLPPRPPVGRWSLGRGKRTSQAMSWPSPCGRLRYRRPSPALSRRPAGPRSRRAAATSSGVSSVGGEPGRTHVTCTFHGMLVKPPDSLKYIQELKRGPGPGFGAIFGDESARSHRDTRDAADRYTGIACGPAFSEQGSRCRLQYGP